MTLALRRAWFQGPPHDPHYDLTARRAASATILGAVTLDRHTFVQRLRANREAAHAS